MNEIEIEISNISNEIQILFFENFSRRLNELNNTNDNSNDINDIISKSIISTLYKRPTDRLDKFKRINKHEENIQCNICFDNFKENEYKRDVICGHNFHKKCIDKWINKYKNLSCPTCRCNLFSKAQQDICFQNLPQ